MPPSPRKKSVTQRVAEQGNNMPMAHMDALLGIEEEGKKQNEALKSILSVQKTSNETLLEIRDKKNPETNFAPLIASVDDVYIKAEEIRTAIENLPQVNLSGVESLLGKILSIEPEKVDLSQLGVISSLLDSILSTVKGLEGGASEDSLKELIAVTNTINENLLSIPEFDYDKLAQVIKDSVNISISASGGAGVLRNVAGNKINPATEEKQDAIITAIGGITTGGSGTQYTEGDVDASITGTAMMMEGAGNTLVPAQGTVLDGLLVNLGSNNDVTVTGTVAVTGSFYQATQPVSAVDLDIRNLVKTQDEVYSVLRTDAGTAYDARQVTLQANSGVDVGDVTINNGAGVSAVNIQDGGNSITVDGTVTANISGSISNTAFNVNNASGASAVNIQDGGNSITVDGTVAVSNATFPVTDNAGSLTVDAPVGTPVFVRISNGASAIDTLPVSLSSVPSHNVTNAGTFAVQSTNQANSGVDIGDVTINNASGASAVNIQDGGNSITVDGTVGVSGTVTTKETRSSTPAQTSPSVTNVNTSILASNANRLGATIYNEGSATCYLKLGSTASTTSYSIQIASGGYYEVPFNYTGAIDGITSASTAQLRVTEIT